MAIGDYFRPQIGPSNNQSSRLWPTSSYKRRPIVRRFPPGWPWPTPVTPLGADEGISQSVARPIAGEWPGLIGMRPRPNPLPYRPLATGGAVGLEPPYISGPYNPRPVDAGGGLAAATGVDWAYVTSAPTAEEAQRRYLEGRTRPVPGAAEALARTQQIRGGVQTVSDMLSPFWQQPGGAPVPLAMETWNRFGQDVFGRNLLAQESEIDRRVREEYYPRVRALQAQRTALGEEEYGRQLTALTLEYFPHMAQPGAPAPTPAPTDEGPSEEGEGPPQEPAALGAGQLLANALAGNPFVSAGGRGRLGRGYAPDLNAISPAFYGQTSPVIVEALLGFLQSLGIRPEDVLHANRQWTAPSLRG